ncbi:MAG: succinylglutamate desuccinylase/aspartoacylase family protein [Candidatus Kaiserbacteria bacterium]|nr:MAG: succinylglutamate desuccinylase/aspartoacylase family protein [Candidatus Kaiserbacteria bacterium]
MKVWNATEKSASRQAIAALEGGIGISTVMQVDGDGGFRMSQNGPGIFEITCESTLPPLVLTGGIHGDEKAGISILDSLIDDIVSGNQRVKRSVLLMFGNLRAMQTNGFKGCRCIEDEVGETSNLNRCFGRGYFETPRCYGEHRANEMMRAVEDFADTHGCPEVIDIHQSFAVPTLRDVRGGVADRSDYTYAMLYPVEDDLASALGWIHEQYSDIVAGAVVNDMQLRHHTFAGYMASTFGSRAATFEQGNIGYVDHSTFTPQLEDNLSRKIAGETKLDKMEGFDVWRYLRQIRKETKDFTFIDDEGNRTNAPLDFLPLPAGRIARDGHREHELRMGERLLFANSTVPIGDRAAAVIERLHTDLVPAP